jgi:hypothetical protein
VAAATPYCPRSLEEHFASAPGRLRRRNMCKPMSAPEIESKVSACAQMLTCWICVHQRVHTAETKVSRPAFHAALVRMLDVEDLCVLTIRFVPSTGDRVALVT